jgi:hypothetical protein
MRNAWRFATARKPPLRADEHRSVGPYHAPHIDRGQLPRENARAQPNGRIFRGDGHGNGGFPSGKCDIAELSVVRD